MKFPLEQRVIWTVGVSTELKDWIKSNRLPTDNSEEDVLRRLIGMLPRERR